MSLRSDRRTFGIALGGITLAALVVRVVFVVVVDPNVPRLSDASAYHLLANQLADGHGFVRPFDLRLLGLKHATAEYPPLFPAVLAAASTVGAKSVEAQRIFCAFLGAGTVALVGLLARRVSGFVTGLVAAGIAAVYPMLFQSDAALMSETLFVLLVTASLLATYWVMDRRGAGRVVVLGALLGLATLTRTEGALLAVLLAGVVAVSMAGASAGRRVLVGASMLLVVAAVCVPWTIRNAVVFHAFVPISSNAGTALAGANCSLTYHGAQLGSWRSTFGATPNPNGECFGGFDVRAPDFDEADAAAAERAKGVRYARDNTRRLVTAVVPARLGRTWAVWRVDQQIQLATLEGRVERWERIGTWMYWVLAPLAIGGLVVMRLRRVPIGPLVAPLVAVTLSTIATYGNQRFRIAAEPVVVVGAATALVAAVGSARTRIAGGNGPVRSG